MEKNHFRLLKFSFQRSSWRIWIWSCSCCIMLCLEARSSQQQGSKKSWISKHFFFDHSQVWMLLLLFLWWCQFFPLSNDPWMDQEERFFCTTWLSLVPSEVFSGIAQPKATTIFKSLCTYVLNTSHYLLKLSFNPIPLNSNRLDRPRQSGIGARCRIRDVKGAGSNPTFIAFCPLVLK